MIGINLRIKALAVFILVFLFSCQFTSAQEYTSHVYKQLDTVELKLNIYYPSGYREGSSLPAIVFYFGGGWVKGDPSHFQPQCTELAERGIIAIAADYRTAGRHGTTPVECLKDARSAFRWVRANSNDLGIDPDRIVSAGGSAGGYLAIALSCIDGFNEVTDDTSVSCLPAASILFNPVINTWENGYGMEKWGDNACEASPLHHTRKLGIPVLIMHGTNDKVVRVEDVRAFRDSLIHNGDFCRLIEYSNCGHGFFNPGVKNGIYYRQTLDDVILFLEEKSFIAGKK